MKQEVFTPITPLFLTLKLKKGDTVAIISPSWRDPSAFTHIYESGIKVLYETGAIKYGINIGIKNTEEAEKISEL